MENSVFYIALSSVMKDVLCFWDSIPIAHTLPSEELKGLGYGWLLAMA